MTEFRISNFFFIVYTFSPYVKLSICRDVGNKQNEGEYSFYKFYKVIHDSVQFLRLLCLYVYSLLILSILWLAYSCAPIWAIDVAPFLSGL